MSLAVHQGGRHCASLKIYDENGDAFPIPSSATVTMTIFKSYSNLIAIEDQNIDYNDEDNDWDNGKIAMILTPEQTEELAPGVYGISAKIEMNGNLFKTRDAFVFEVIKSEA